MEEDQSLAAVASAVLARLEPVLARERPDWVLVQGDTATVAAAALATYYAGARVGHVEAGPQPESDAAVVGAPTPTEAREEPPARPRRTAEPKPQPQPQPTPERTETLTPEAPAVAADEPPAATTPPEPEA